MVGYVIPAEIKITVNVNSVPAVSVNIDKMVPSSVDDTINVEVFERNDTAALKNDYVESTSETISGTTINIDLSNQNLGFGQTSLTPPQPSVISIKTTSVPAMVHEEKCNQYYDIGTRRSRMVHVHIIGGTYSAQMEFPHMAALGYGTRSATQWLCGGSLISEEYVITAAHCLSAKSLGDIQYVRLGTTTLQTETLESQDYNVVARIPHPDFIPDKQYNDIALLKLDRPVSFSASVAPICLAASRYLDGAKFVAAGWGKMDSGDVSTELQKVDLEYVPRDVCQRGYEGVPSEELPDGIREESQLCAAAPEGSKDTCQGDSGGPLQMQQDGRMYLIGITSFGIGCGKAETPGVYTRVSYYIPWIESIVWRQ